MNHYYPTIFITLIVGFVIGYSAAKSYYRSKYQLAEEFQNRLFKTLKQEHFNNVNDIIPSLFALTFSSRPLMLDCWYTPAELFHYFNPQNHI